MSSTHVSSANRDSGNTSDFRVVSPQSLSAGPYDLDNVQLTNCAYNVGPNNNEITWTESGQSTVTSLVTPGNYDEDTILAAVKSAMEADADSAVITVTFNETTGKLTIASTVALILDPSRKNSVLPYLGFNVVTASTTSAVSDGVLAMDYPSSVFLRLDEFSGCFSTEIYGQYSAQVPLTGGFRSTTLVKQQEYASRVYLGKTLRQLRIRLYDAQDRLIDNNGGNVSFTLRRLSSDH